MKFNFSSVLLSLVALAAVPAIAKDFDCRWNTINGKPILRIWSKDGNQDIKSEKFEFSSYSKRDAAVKICSEFFADVTVDHGEFEFKVGTSVLGATFVKKGYGTFRSDTTLLSRTNDSIKSTRAEELQFVSDYVGKYIRDQIEN